MSLPRIAALLLLGCSATGALAQSVSAEAADGRTVLLYEDGIWIDSANVWTGLRLGEGVESETGRFTVHLPEGWTASPSSGEMFQGEILFTNDMDSTYVSPLFVPDSSGATLQQFADEFVEAMEPEPEYGDQVTPLARYLIAGRRAVWRRIIESSGTALQLAAIEAPDGIVMVIGMLPPGVSDDNLNLFLRSIEITEPEAP